jgi:hypothetical protein
MPSPGTAAHEDHEKAVTGEAADKAKAAALKAVGGGTAGDVTTDYFGNGYEVTVTQSDDSKVEVHLDSSFEVMGAFRSAALGVEQLSDYSRRRPGTRRAFVLSLKHSRRSRTSSGCERLCLLRPRAGG